jgi:hypothetical protein
VLFSKKEVAEYINRAFEPVWETVRPVPIVRVDFGNGNVVTRTLHGNIATYVCDAEGRILDILPGIYSPAEYRQGLEQLSLLARYVQRPDRRAGRLTNYHRTLADNLRQHQPVARLVDTGGMSKRVIEDPIKLVLAPDRAEAPAPNRSAAGQPDADVPPEDLATWRLLADDTRINETARRLQIHEHLAGAGAVKPQGIVKWLYKEVLHADLDDPYLGLGNVLFAHYPFAKEDRR